MAEKNNKKLTGFLVVGLVFLVPLASWFYLRAGFEYQKEAYAQLDSIGIVPTFQYTDQYDTELDTAFFRGRVLLLNVLPDGKETETVDRLAKLFDQFDETGRVYVLTLVNPEQRSKIREARQMLELTAEDHWSLVEVGNDELRRLTAQFPEKDTKRYRQGLIALVDRYGFVRNYYDPLVNEEMGMLIRHLTFVMPRDAKEEVELLRRRDM